MKRFAVPMILGALAMSVAASRADAQAFVYFGGGPSFPVGSFKTDNDAKTGWQMNAGIGVNLSQGFFIEAGGFFGSNSHANTGNFKEKTNVIAGMAELGKEFGAADAKVHPYIIAGAGIVAHQFRTDNDNAVESTESKFGGTGALGLSITLNEVAHFWVEGRVIAASGTTVVPFMAGISLQLGKKK